LQLIDRLPVRFDARVVIRYPVRMRGVVEQEAEERPGPAIPDVSFGKVQPIAGDLQVALPGYAAGRVEAQVLDPGENVTIEGWADQDGRRQNCHVIAKLLHALHEQRWGRRCREGIRSEEHTSALQS